MARTRREGIGQIFCLNRRFSCELKKCKDGNVCLKMYETIESHTSIRDSGKPSGDSWQEGKKGWGERKGVVRRGCGWVEVVDLIQPFMGGNCELLPRLNCGGGGMNVIYGQTQPPPQTGQHFCIYEKLKHPSKSSLVDAKDFFLLLSASFSRSSKSRIFLRPALQPSNPHIPFRKNIRLIPMSLLLRSPSIFEPPPPFQNLLRASKNAKGPLACLSSNHRFGNRKMFCGNLLCRVRN